MVAPRIFLLHKIPHCLDNVINIANQIFSLVYRYFVGNIITFAKKQKLSCFVIKSTNISLDLWVFSILINNFALCSSRGVKSNRFWVGSLVKGSITPEKVAGQNYRSQGIAPWNYSRARRARPMMSGTYPRKRSFDSWIVTKLRRVRSAFVNRNDSRVRHVTGIFALFKILLNNSDLSCTRRGT